MLYFTLQSGKVAMPVKEVLMKVLPLLYSLGTLNQTKSSQGNNNASRYYTDIDPFSLNVFKRNSPTYLLEGTILIPDFLGYAFRGLLKSSSICWHEIGSYFMTNTR